LIIDGIDVSRTYPAEEVLKMWEDGHLREVCLKGYVARANGDGTCGFVPWYEAMDAFNEHRGLRKYTIPQQYVEDMKSDVEEKHPIVRRTPQQRVAAMVLRLMGEARQYGKIPGLSDEALRAIVGEYWKSGDPVTEDVVRRVAAYYLGVAEVDNREENAKHSTSVYPTA
jgi:hypothetical protein